MSSVRNNKKSLPLILLAEDSQTTATLLIKYLDNSYRLLLARDGVAAWEMLQTNKEVDLVITDINMPNMTGHQLLVKIRRSKDERISNLPVILMTTTEDTVDRNLAFLNGANDFITKPIDEMEILARVNVHYKLGRVIRDFAKQRNFVGAIQRSIEFGPGDKQAGIAILSYFSQILRQKYPGIDAKVTIEQEDQFVRMIIETPDGQKEKVEKALWEYGLVVQGKMAPEELVSNPLAVMELKNKLEISRLELDQTRRLLTYAETTSTNRIASLERQVETLNTLVGETLKGTNNAFTIIDKMMQTYSMNDAVRGSLELIASKITSGIKSADEAEIKQALKEVHSENPRVLSELKDFFKGVLQGAGGDLLSSWIMTIINSLPK